MKQDWQIRPLQPGDDLIAITGLLHRAYAPLAQAGMNFTAATQSVDETRARMAKGHTLLAVRGHQIVGTLTVGRAHDPNLHGWARVSPWLYRDDVAHLQQFAVEPATQRSGVGAALMQAAQAWCREQGLQAVALDTALPAQTLRELYARQGFDEVGTLQWPGKHYRSVVMAKALSAQALSPSDPAHRVAIVRCLWACFQARDWAGARCLLADHAQLYWRASDETMLDADAFIRVNAIYPEGWTLRVIEVSALVDGRVHSLIEVRQGEDRFIANTLWRFENNLIVHADETFATFDNHPPAWRTAEAIGAYRRGNPNT